MSNNVQIPYSLFALLIRFFFADDKSVEPQIKAALELKVERMAAHQTYMEVHQNGKNQTNT